MLPARAGFKARVRNTEVTRRGAERSKAPLTERRDPSKSGTGYFSLQTKWGIDTDTNEFILYCPREEMKQQAESLNGQTAAQDTMTVTGEEVIIGDASLPIRA